MQIKRIVTLGAAALGLVLAVPAFAQTPRDCIHFSIFCSDNPYPTTAPAPKPMARHAYNRHWHHHLYNAAAPAPQPADPRACVHFSIFCSDNPYAVTHS